MFSLRRAFAPIRIAHNACLGGARSCETKIMSREDIPEGMVYGELEDSSQHMCNSKWPYSWHHEMKRPGPTRKTPFWERLFEEYSTLLCWQLPPFTMEGAANLQYAFFSNGMDLHQGLKKDLHPFLLNSKYRNLTRPLQGSFAISVSRNYEIKKSLKLVRDFPGVELVAGCIDQQLLTREQVINLSKSPSLEILQSELVGVLSSPAFLLSAYLQKYVDDQQQQPPTDSS